MQTFRGFPGGSAVKNPPAVWETKVRSLGLEDPLEEEMATDSSVLFFFLIEIIYFCLYWLCYHAGFSLVAESGGPTL